MRKLLLALGLWLLPTLAFAQCTGVFPNNTICGNFSGTAGPPSAFSATTSLFGPTSSTSGDIPTFATTTGNQLTDAPSIATSQSITFNAINWFSDITSLYIANITSVFEYHNTALIPAGTGSNNAFTGNNTFSGTSAFSGATSFTNTTSISNLIVDGNGPLTIPLSVTFGGNGLTSITSHAVQVGEGTNPIAAVGPGSVGQCLAGAGATADPSFISGCRVLITPTTIAVSGTVAVSGIIPAGYNDYELVIENCAPVNANATLTLLDLIFTNTPATSNYTDNTQFVQNNQVVTGVTSTASIPLSGTAGAGVEVSNSSVMGWSGSVRLYSATGPGYRRWVGLGGFWNGTNDSPVNFTGYLSATTTVAGWQLEFGNGNIAACTVKLYGMQ